MKKTLLVAGLVMLAALIAAVVKRKKKYATAQIG